MKKLDISRLQETLDNRIEADIASGRVSGCGVMVVQENGGSFEKYYGSKTVDGGVKLDENCLFRLASMTKPVTAVCAMMLYDEGLLDIDAPVEKYLPEYSRMRLGEVDENGNEIRSRPFAHKPTVRMLMNHTSLIDWGGTFSRQYKKITPEQFATLDGSVGFYSSLILKKEPGSFHSYSGTVAFDVLAGIVSRLSGMPYEDFVRERLTEPLGMKDTAFAPSKEQWERFVEMHDYKDGKAVSGEVVPDCVFCDYPVTHALGGAGLFGSVRDYAAFAYMLIDGTCGGKRFLSPEAVKLMSTPEYPTLWGSSHCWGLGVRVVDGVSDCSSKRLPLGSFGWSGAFGTHFWVDPADRLIAVYMKNSHFDDGSSAKTSANFEIDVTSSLV
ncbi:MAG: beta-lactamase family protein [Clostridia bacterium]|nr:beta-lactamase family protein [Clostridia bacterium]